MTSISHSMERTAAQALLNHFYDNLADPSERMQTLMKIADLVPKFYKEIPPERIDSQHLPAFPGRPVRCVGPAA